MYTPLFTNKLYGFRDRCHSRFSPPPTSKICIQCYDHRDRTTTISMPSTLRPPSASCAANVLWTVAGQLFEDIGAVRWQSPFHLKTLIGRIVLVSLHNRGFILASPFHFLVKKKRVPTLNQLKLANGAMLLFLT